jgi:MerR family transcriptional regulator, mercuric resistance operon regulatory protein
VRLPPRRRSTRKPCGIYERRGLLRKPAQQLGFTLDDIEDLLHLAGGGPESCDEARAMARGRIDDLQQRIDELAGMRDALTRLVETCGEARAERHCPILHDIETAVGAK